MTRNIHDILDELYSARHAAPELCCYFKLSACPPRSVQRSGQQVSELADTALRTAVRKEVADCLAFG